MLGPALPTASAQPISSFTNNYMQLFPENRNSKTYIWVSVFGVMVVHYYLENIIKPSLADGHLLRSLITAKR